MTVDELHDALTLLPADLVAEADKWRSRKRAIVSWHRWAAMAACFCLILGCSLLTGVWTLASTKCSQSAPAAADAAPAESPKVFLAQIPEDAPMDSGSQEDVSESAVSAAGAFAPGIGNIRWVETPYDSSTESRTNESPEALLLTSQTELEKYFGSIPQLQTEALREAAVSLDEGWFADHDLLVIRLDCSDCMVITGISQQEGRWQVCLEDGAYPVSCYHILITVQKGLMEGPDPVTVLYDSP